MVNLRPLSIGAAESRPFVVINDAFVAYDENNANDFLREYVRFHIFDNDGPFEQAVFGLLRPTFQLLRVVGEQADIVRALSDQYALEMNEISNSSNLLA